MTHLPHAATARVAEEKVRDYLLNPDNPQNRGKAAKFTSFGFTRGGWRFLAGALRAHPVVNMVVETARSPHGVKYVVECSLQTPDARNPCIRSVWIIDLGESLPRLVTAY
jgi:hypothetical protein